MLRFIQTGTFRKVGSNQLEKVDVRFVCATNRDPLEEVREGRFREDLFYRLHVVPVRMPPLRERDDDVLMIARHFLAQFSDRENKAFAGFSEAAEKAIKRYAWPGNVRQLQNAMHQLVVLSDGEVVDEGMLPTEVTSGHLEVGGDRARGSADGPRQDKQALVAHLNRREKIEPLWLTEKRAIEDAIDICGGNINSAAGLLEVSPSTIYRKLQGWKKLQA